MASDLIINKDTYDDLLKMHGKPAFTEVFNEAKRVIFAGGKVIIQQKYVNAPPDFCKVMSSEKDLADWEAEVLQNTKYKPQ